MSLLTVQADGELAAILRSIRRWLLVCVVEFGLSFS